jgi:ribosomal protein L23
MTIFAKIINKSRMPEYDIALELARLHILQGADFVRQLKMLAQYNIFKLIENERDIYAAEGSHREDFPMLLDAARKAVVHGNKVYILPNPKGIRTADFIFENKGIFKMYDLKTISGKASLENRLMESIGQTNHVLINVCTKYNPRLMATQIRSYFQVNPKAIEVLVYKGKKAIVITRRIAENPLFLIQFQRKFVK